MVNQDSIGESYYFEHALNVYLMLKLNESQ